MITVYKQVNSRKTIAFLLKNAFHTYQTRWCGDRRCQPKYNGKASLWTDCRRDRSSARARQYTWVQSGRPLIQSYFPYKKDNIIQDFSFSFCCWMHCSALALCKTCALFSREPALFRHVKIVITSSVVAFKQNIQMTSPQCLGKKIWLRGSQTACSLLANH